MRERGLAAILRDVLRSTPNLIDRWAVSIARKMPNNNAAVGTGIGMGAGGAAVGAGSEKMGAGPRLGTLMVRISAEFFWGGLFSLSWLFIIWYMFYFV